MALADKLQLTLNTKNAIKQALIDKGAEPTDVFSSYPALIEGLSSGGFPVGTVADWKMDQSAEGWLLADGSAVSETAYSELYALVGDVFNDASEPAGYFRLPDLPPVTHGNVTVQPMIKAE